MPALLPGKYCKNPVLFTMQTTIDKAENAATIPVYGTKFPYDTLAPFPVWLQVKVIKSF
jgi:hypothetical protein